MAQVFEKVAVLVPTRGRVGRLLTLLDSFRATSTGCSKLFFRVDDDDVETQNVLAGESYVVGPRLDGYKSLPAFFNELASVADGDVLMCGNDDIVFRTPGWDRLILDAANCYADGIFDFGMNTHNSPNFPLATTSRRVVDTLGFIFDERFFWGDIFLRDVMSRFGRAIQLPAVQIDHDWAGFSPDRVFMEGEETRRGVDGRFHSQAVEEAVAKLKPLVTEGAAA